jgi:hypothetical protein
MTDQEKNFKDKMWCSVWCGDGTVTITKKPDVHSPKCPYYEDQPNTGDVTDWEKEFDDKFCPEQSNGFIEDRKTLDVFQEGAIKDFISKLLANQRQEIVDKIQEVENPFDREFEKQYHSAETMKYIIIGSLKEKE